MSIDATIPVWPHAPDWSEIVRERIEHRTDVLVAEDGSAQTRATRLTPRRSFEYLQSLTDIERQAATNLAWGYGARRFYLPIWTDGMTVAPTTSPPGTLDLTTPTAGFDFAAGQVAMLQGPNSARPYELVEIDSIGTTSIELVDAPALEWAPGSVLYPVRKAYLDDAFTQSAFTPGMGYGRIRWIIAEANPYPGAVPATTYRTMPVLTQRPAYAHDPTLALERPLALIDDDIAVRDVYDPVGIPLYSQTMDWQLYGRPALAEFRSLVYGLQGKRNSIWIPSWLDDLTPTASIAATATTLAVAWCGYTTTVAQAINRRDIRIQLTNGTVLYRRITASVEAGDNELLTLDAHLGQGRTVGAAEFAQVSFMGLCRSDSDIAELGWWTGDYADVTTAWRGRNHDL